MTNKNNKAFAAILICAQALFLFLGMAVFSGCSEEEEEEKLNFENKVYIPNLTDRSITILPARKSDEPDTLTLERNPRFIAQVPGQDRLFALLDGTNDIAVIDTKEDSVDDYITFDVQSPVPQENLRILFNSNGSRAYVVTSYSQALIAVMNPSDLSFEEGIMLESTGIDELYLSTGENRLYAIDSSRKRIFTINTQTNDLIEELIVPESFGVTCFNPNTNLLYMAEEGSRAAVKVYDISSGEFTQRVENTVDNAVKLMLNTDKTKLYAIGSQQMSVIGLSSFIVDETITFEHRGVSDFQLLPNGKFFLAASTFSDLIMVLKPDLSSKDTINTGRDPGEFVIID